MNQFSRLLALKMNGKVCTARESSEDPAPGCSCAIERTQEIDSKICYMTRKAQEPLADIKAIMTDNTIAFNGGPDKDDTSYGFQLQPVYAIPTDDMNMILRAVVPIVGVEQEVVIPPLGPD